MKIKVQKSNASAFALSWTEEVSSLSFRCTFLTSMGNGMRIKRSMPYDWMVDFGNNKRLRETVPRPISVVCRH